jgi:hypothetical protein
MLAHQILVRRNAINKALGCTKESSSSSRFNTGGKCVDTSYYVEFFNQPVYRAALQLVRRRVPDDWQRGPHRIDVSKVGGYTI